MYTITQVSEKLDIKEPTLRKWEKDFKFLKIPRDELGHRFYKDEHIEIIENIKKLKDEGANSIIINKILSKTLEVQDQKVKNMDLITVDKMTGQDLNDLVSKQVETVLAEQNRELKEVITAMADGFKEVLIQREEDLKKDFEEQLERVKDDILDKQREQLQVENKKLMEYVAASRQEDIAMVREQEKKKGFFAKLLGK